MNIQEIILSEIKEIKENINKKRDSGLEIFFKIVEKLLIPILICVVAFIGSNATTAISEGQLALAQTTAEDRKEEFRRTMQAKYFEIFYKDLNSGEQKNQLNAIRLVRLVDADLGQRLLDLVVSTPGVSATVIAKVDEVKRDLEIVRPLIGYKVYVYYYEGSIQSKGNAQILYDSIQKSGFNGTVQLKPADENFFRKYDPPKTIEIRYEEKYESEAANSLYAILSSKIPSNNIIKAIVKNRTENFISIFVPRGTP